MFDAIDLRLLGALQRQADLPLEALGEAVGLSRNAVWRRVRALEAEGVIRGRVALLDAGKVGCGLTVFMLIRTDQHTPDWQEAFRKAVRDLPEITQAHRMTGDLDYLVVARVTDVAGYDALYQRLIRRVPISDISASFVMEALKDSTELPLGG